MPRIVSNKIIIICLELRYLLNFVKLARTRKLYWFRFCSFLFALYMVCRHVDVLLITILYTLRAFIICLMFSQPIRRMLSTKEHYCILCFFRVVNLLYHPIRTSDTINRWCNIRFRLFVLNGYNMTYIIYTSCCLTVYTFQAIS